MYKSKPYETEDVRDMYKNDLITSCQDLTANIILDLKFCVSR